LVMRIRFDPAQRQSYLREVLRRAQSVPGVTSAGISSWGSLIGAPALPSDRSTGTTHVIRFNAISPGYLRAMGMRLLKGRWLTDADGKGAVMMNESMAREAFGDANPIGSMMYKIRSPIVVGVVADLQYSQLDSPAPAEVFMPYQNPDAPAPPNANFAVRTTAPQAVAEDLGNLSPPLTPASRSTTFRPSAMLSPRISRPAVSISFCSALLRHLRCSWP
jgi:putative ABC transport system permease protein